jgi:hypothetical protein
VIINDLDVEGVSLTPHKTNAPPVVNTDAVLTLTVAFQGLKPVPQGHHQILQPPGAMEVEKLSTGDPFNSAEPGNVMVVK